MFNKATNKKSQSQQQKIKVRKAHKKILRKQAKNFLSKKMNKPQNNKPNKLVMT